MPNAGLKVDFFLGNHGKRQFLFGKIAKKEAPQYFLKF